MEGLYRTGTSSTIYCRLPSEQRTLSVPKCPILRDFPVAGSERGPAEDGSEGVCVSGPRLAPRLLPPLPLRMGILPQTHCESILTS